MKTFKCTKCGSTKQWEAWSGKDQLPLKCEKCGKLTMHKEEADLADLREHLNERDRENDPPSAQEIGDWDYPDDRYDR